MESGKCGGLLGALLFGGGSGGGAGGGTMYVEATKADEVITLNKNFKEITDAVAAGMAVILHQLQIETSGDNVEVSIDTYFPLDATFFADGYYIVSFMNHSNSESFGADSETAPLTKG